MIEEIGMLLVLLNAINLLVNLVKWFLDSRKSPPVTYLELLMAGEFTKKNDVTKRDLEILLDENSEDLKLFIFEEIRKDAKRKFDATLKKEKK